MRLSATTTIDPNQLPYFVTDGAGNLVPVEFVPLTSTDAAELSGFDWLGSVFQPTWIHLCGAPVVYKLVEPGTASPIIGLIHIGKVAAGFGALKGSLLETAPVHRFRPNNPLFGFRGVGRVLVARLIVESYNTGGSGAVRVDARSGAVNFYRRIGFVQERGFARTHRLSAQQAGIIFEKVTI